MRMALLGGSFNPFHLGHLAVAEALWQELHYECVLLVPAYTPAHKSPDVRTDPMHRLRMVEAVAAQYAFLAVEDCEIRRGGVSYTIDTVHHVLGSYAVDGRLGVVIGEDLLGGLGSWKESDALLELVELLVAARGASLGGDLPAGSRPVPNRRMDISSSDIRERVRAGLPIAHLVPEPVGNYILSRNLYRN